MADNHSSHIAVDLGDLHDVVTWLREQAQSLTGDRDHLQPSVHFGQHSPCGETRRARGAALSMLDDHRLRWGEHREELASLATALDKALDHYADIDSGEDLRKLEQ